MINKTAIKENLTFFFNFFFNFKNTGSIIPSSKYLGKEMIYFVDTDKPQIIFELGAGVGNITKWIKNKAHIDSKIYAIEINQSFCKILEKKFDNSNVYIIKESVADVQKISCSLGVVPDIIISGLPLSNFSNDFIISLLTNCKNILSPKKGVFSQFQYSKKRMNILKRIMPCYKIKYIFLNIPGAYVFHYQKDK